MYQNLRISSKILQFYSSLRIIASDHSIFCKMPKKNAKKCILSKETNLVESSTKTESIELDKQGNILINIHCKPGSTSNMIKGDQPRLDIKIHARAVEGQANTELIAYLAEVLEVRKSDFTIIHGLKSREKTLTLSSDVISLEEAKEKIRKEIALSNVKS